MVSSTDAVLDAIRVGQEALDKATLVQANGQESGFTYLELVIY